LSASDKKVISEIEFEISQIEQLLATYADLLKRVQDRSPDTVEIAAIASVLHSFYNGIEKTFLSIAKAMDAGVPLGERSHRELLIQMTKKMARRRAVISEKTSKTLVDYLAFRHFYRHSYSFVLDWEELKKLALPLNPNWSQIKSDLLGFVENLK